MEEEKKYYELDENQRKQKRHELWTKFKPTLKKILFVSFIVLICLLMVIALIGTRNRSSNNNTSNAIVLYQ